MMISSPKNGNAIQLPAFRRCLGRSLQTIGGVKEMLWSPP